jgi:hypothetical protein
MGHKTRRQFTLDEEAQLKQARARGSAAGRGLRQAFTGRKAKTLKARDLKKGNKFKVARNK